jgi:hypothetical protein
MIIVLDRDLKKLDSLALRFAKYHYLMGVAYLSPFWDSRSLKVLISIIKAIIANHMNLPPPNRYLH